MADACYAVKKLVFEDKKLTLEEYKEAMDNNFGFGGITDDQAREVTEEIVKQLAKNGVDVTEKQIADIYLQAKGGNGKYAHVHDMIDALPKYGNDNGDVDMIAREVAYTYTRPLEKYKNPRGGQFQAGLYPVSANVPLGAQTGATPDGRRAKDPINEGVSPYTGTDTSTCLAALRSSAKLNHDIHSGGTLLNLRLNHDLVATKRGRANLGAMLQSYFALGAFHVQFNTISNEVLKDAQAHPENYRDLLVRVAGYSTQFVNLSKSMQDSIMARNAHEEF